jgi:2-oxoglutarate ferredoxin oxidoreductase subunit alpha
MTPVFFLSDGYIANGAEPWLFPQSKDLKPISVPITKKESADYLPYKRDHKLVREWAIPGMSGLEHRVGGLEKEAETGNVSYDSNNHEFMVKTRAQKVERIADFIPNQELDAGKENAKVLVLAWGSTYGAIKTAVKELLSEGYSVAHAHLRYINPFPKNLETLIQSYDKVLMPEINDGQLIKLIRDKYLIDAIPMNKIQGIPFEAREIKNRIIELHDGE